MLWCLFARARACVCFLFILVSVGYTHSPFLSLFILLAFFGYIRKMGKAWLKEKPGHKSSEGNVTFMSIYYAYTDSERLYVH